MKKKIAIVDFDGTIIDHAFPEIKEPMPDAFEVLKELKEAGWVLILSTCREDCPKRKYLTEAVEFCRKNSVEFDGVNETPLDHEFRDERGLRRKPYGDVYIDDRNIGGFVGWKVIRKVLLGGEKIYWSHDSESRRMKKTLIHVNQHVIKSNKKTGAREPVLTVKTYDSNSYGHQAVIHDNDGREVARVVYRPDKPLNCGSTVWIEVEGKNGSVEVIQNETARVERRRQAPHGPASGHNCPAL